MPLGWPSADELTPTAIITVILRLINEAVLVKWQVHTPTFAIIHAVPFYLLHTAGTGYADCTVPASSCSQFVLT